MERLNKWHWDVYVLREITKPWHDSDDKDSS